MKKRLVLLAFLILLPWESNYAFQAKFTNLVVSLTGRVFDEVTKKPVSARIEAFDEKGTQVYRGNTNAEQNGYYFITGLHPGEKYTVKFGDFKYFKQKFEIEIPNTDKYAEFSRDFLITPRLVGLKIPLMVPPFEINKTKVRVGADYFLSDIVATIRDNPRIKFEINCFPDNGNDSTANSALTNERCQALRDYFQSNGISLERIALKGSASCDADNPPPIKKRAKGKRYIGSTYIVITQI